MRREALSVDPVLQTIVRAAVEAAGAAQGWVLGVDGDRLRVVAAAGGEAGRMLGAHIPAGQGTAGFVVQSGAPLAMAPRGDDPRFEEGMAELLGRRPSSVLTVPCTTDDGVQGALELIDKSGGATFTFDDVELATLLAGVAGASLAHSVAEPPSIPDPAQLGAELQKLAGSDPARYAALAAAVVAWLDHG